MRRLDNKVVVITGAMGGLGTTVTSVFAETGANVMAVDRAVSGPLPTGVTGFAGDVADEAEVGRLVREVVIRLGRIDALVNLVGGFAMGRAVETDVGVWQKMLTVNLTSAFLLSKAVAPIMLKQGAGRIVHIAARAALDPFPGAAAYLVAKSGLIALVRALALELTGTGVSVNAVLPATIDTPANRKSMPEADPHSWVKPDAIAGLLVFLISDEARGLNGALIPIGST
ncbi:SDR family NAD(P)-dependent oxidoreductase [Candidatus Nitrospira bockiana]